MKTLKVRGTGNIEQSPDLVIFSFEIYSKKINYQECNEDMNARINYLYDDIIKAGFKKGDLKSTFFDVGTFYETVKNKRVLGGYTSTCRFRLEFDYNKDKLNKLLCILSESKAESEFKINFGIKDKKAFNNKLLENAVTDSRSKAEIIVKCSGVKLGDILNIDYSWNVIKFESDFELSENCCHALEEPSAPYDFEPDEVKAKDSITVLWEIK